VACSERRFDAVQALAELREVADALQAVLDGSEPLREIALHSVDGDRTGWTVAPVDEHVRGLRPRPGPDEIEINAEQLSEGFGVLRLQRTGLLPLDRGAFLDAGLLRDLRPRQPRVALLQFGDPGRPVLVLCHPQQDGTSTSVSRQ
jgi:hypothetical protein